MRRFFLSGIFFVLLTALYFLWQHRFERCPEFPSFTLADLRATADRLPPGAEWVGPAQQPSLRLRVDPEHPEVVARLSLPIRQAVAFLHLRFRISATGLVPGDETWEDGRGFIEWHPPDGGAARENDLFGSARLTQIGETTEIVLRPEHSPAIPALHLENIGTRGDFELSSFEATVLRERESWKIGRWWLLAGWLGWVLAWIGPHRWPGLPRAVGAAVVWLLMGVYFVIPGPWSDVRSMAGPFQIGRQPASSPASAERPEIPPVNLAPQAFPAVKSLGKVPTRGDFTLRLKLYATHARPLLHTLMLFAPTLVIAVLGGRSAALSLAVILAVAIEAAQLAFGFGFDWVDVFDLACDVLGIALALWVYGWLGRRWPVGFLEQPSSPPVAAPFPKPSAPAVAGGGPN
ncbi:hypothetical protein HQ447_09770 [bacterium]|nr:hypothetical protein [bacterium]